MDARDAQSADARMRSEPGDRVEWLAGGSDLFLVALTMGPGPAGPAPAAGDEWPANQLPSANCRYAAAAVKRARAH